MINIRPKVLENLKVTVSQFICSVMSDSLWPHGLQHARLPCPSPAPGACSNSCPLSQWCHPTISFSVVPFSSCLQSFPASWSFTCFYGTVSLAGHTDIKLGHVLLSVHWRSSVNTLFMAWESQGHFPWYASLTLGTPEGQPHTAHPASP